MFDWTNKRIKQHSCETTVNCFLHFSRLKFNKCVKQCFLSLYPLKTYFLFAFTSARLELYEYNRKWNFNYIMSYIVQKHYLRPSTIAEIKFLHGEKICSLSWIGISGYFRCITKNLEPHVCKNIESFTFQDFAGNISYPSLYYACALKISADTKKGKGRTRTCIKTIGKRKKKHHYQ